MILRTVLLGFLVANWSEGRGQTKRDDKDLDGVEPLLGGELAGG